MDQAKAAIAFKSLEITSDGTTDNTVLKVNGQVVADICSLSFSFYDDEYGDGVFVRYTVTDKPGTVLGGNLSECHTYHLVTASKDGVRALVPKPGIPADMVNILAAAAVFAKM